MTLAAKAGKLTAHGAREISLEKLKKLDSWEGSGQNMTAPFVILGVTGFGESREERPSQWIEIEAPALARELPCPIGFVP